MDKPSGKQKIHSALNVADVIVLGCVTLSLFRGGMQKNTQETQSAEQVSAIG